MKQRRWTSPSPLWEGETTSYCQLFFLSEVLINSWWTGQNDQAFFRTNYDLFPFDPSLLPSPWSLPKECSSANSLSWRIWREGLLYNVSNAEEKLLSSAYLSVIAGCLGYKLQGWLCCPLLSQGDVLLHNKRSTLHLQLWASVRFFTSNISQA